MVKGQPDTATDAPTPDDVYAGVTEAIDTKYQDRYGDDVVVKEMADGITGFEVLFTPRTRAAILGVLVENTDRPLSVAEIVERSHDVSTSGFQRHKDQLLTIGVMREAGKVGNAMIYELNTDHPLGQLLMMLDDVLAWGRTSMELDEQFIKD